MTKIVILGDTHNPYQDDVAISVGCRVIKEFKPNIIVHLGDGLDFYACSSFSRDPNRVLELQRELDSFRNTMELIGTAAGNAKKHYLWGNHERRWERFLWTHPEIANLERLKLENLLGLTELGWTLEEEIRHLTILVTHGARVSKHSGWSVKRELEDRFYQINVAMGHSHRVGHVCATGYENTVQGWEVGCLCRTTPWYNSTMVNNWQQGLLLLTIGKDRLGAEQIIFEDGHTMFRGKRY